MSTQCQEGDTLLHKGPYAAMSVAVRHSTCQTPQAVWPRGSGGQVPGSLPCSQSMHMAQLQELEAASRSSETYLAENGGGRPASVQPRSCIRVQEGTGQNYLARTHGNSYVTDKPRMKNEWISAEAKVSLTRKGHQCDANALLKAMFCKQYLKFFLNFCFQSSLRSATDCCRTEGRFNKLYRRAAATIYPAPLLPLWAPKRLAPPSRPHLQTAT